MRDNQLILSEAQAITTDAYSEKVVDKGAAGALGKTVELVVSVGTTFDTAEEDGTLQIKLRTSPALTGSDLSAAAVDLAMSKVWDEADLVAGTELFRIALPAGLKEYVQVYYEVGTHAFTAGKVNADFRVGTAEIRP